MGTTLPDLADHEALLAQVEELAAGQARLAELVRSVAHPPLMLTVAEAVGYTGLTQKTLFKLREAGELVWHNIEGSHRYSRSDLDAVIARRTAPSIADRSLRAVPG